MPAKSRASPIRSKQGSKDPCAEWKRKLNERDAELREALEEQTATREILRIISSSRTDTQRVFDAVAESVARLCQAHDVVIRLVDGNVHRAVAHHGSIPPAPPRSITRATVAGCAMLDVQMLHIPDITDARVREQYPETGFAQHRTILVAPLIRTNEAIGAIVMRRLEVRPFTDSQIKLLETFAAQAVIAIENARLFNETQEALEQQTATGEILRVISESPTDTQPVFDAIVNSAVRLFGGLGVTLRLVNGDETEVVASTRPGVARPNLVNDDRYASSRAILRRQVVHVPDVLAESWITEETKRNAEVRGRSIMCAAMLREDRAIGSLIVNRANPGPYSEKQVAVLQTFADQAVIAIENVRLFKELQARNAEVTESLEQQTATADILRVISGSPTDLRPVFDAILENATRLCDAHMANLGLYDGESYQARAQHGLNAELVKFFAELGPFRPPANMGIGRMIAKRQPIQFPDLREEPGYRERSIPSTVALVELGGVRTFLAVPMLKEGRVIGGIAVLRPEVRPFTDKQIALLRTFADQAVIAIENVRLFNEIQDKSRQLESANKHKSEFLANMSHELRTPLNAVIGFSEVLQQGMVGELNDKQGEYINYIHTSGSHLLSLINDILDLSKVEAGRMELDLTDFNVPMVIDNALTLVRERATHHGLTLDCTLDPAIAEISADERKFKQVMLNLLSNAVKFTPGGGRIAVSARAVNDTVEVSVTDTGIGIATEDCDAVFEEFRQVGTLSEGKAQGTGLGLALTKKFIELHGGKIWLTSAVGQGSIFSFTLPIKQPEGQA